MSQIGKMIRKANRAAKESKIETDLSRLLTTTYVLSIAIENIAKKLGVPLAELLKQEQPTEQPKPSLEGATPTEPAPESKL